MPQHNLVSTHGWPDERFTPEVIAGLVGKRLKVTAPTHDWTRPEGTCEVVDAALEDDGLHLRVEADERAYESLRDGRDVDPLPVSIGFAMLLEGVHVYDVSAMHADGRPVT